MKLLLGMLCLSYLITVPLWCQTPSDAHLQESPSSAISRETLIAVVNKIVSDPILSRYFKTVDLEHIHPTFSVPRNPNDGWIWSWSCIKDVQMIPNPDTSSNIVAIPSVTTKDGIQFAVFITFDHGGDLVSRTKTFIASKPLKINIAYDFVISDYKPPHKYGEELSTNALQVRDKLNTIVGDAASALSIKLSSTQAK